MWGKQTTRPLRVHSSTGGEFASINGYLAHSRGPAVSKGRIHFLTWAILWQRIFGARIRMNRFFNWVKSLFGRFMDKVEDPEMILDQAKRDMEQALRDNREKGVQAITQKNKLQLMLEDERRKAAELEAKATMALKQGQRDLALSLMREKMTHDGTAEQLQKSYDQASQVADQVKVALQRQQEEVRKKTAEALALKAQWKQAQIQNAITKTLEGFDFDTQFSNFGVAQEKIRNVQSELAARQELYGTTMQGKIMELEDKSRDEAADLELQKLEQRLGMGASASVNTSTTDVQQEQHITIGDGTTAPATPAPDAAQEQAAKAEAEKQLEELEKRLQGNS